MPTIKGIAASSGVAIAKVHSLTGPELSFEEKTPASPETELQRLEKAIRHSADELEDIKAHANEVMDDTHAAIFSAHLLILNDPDFIKAIKEKVNGHSILAEKALIEATNQFTDQLSQLDNAYMQERISDVRDISKRILAHLLGVSSPDTSFIDEEVIIVANDLRPSDTVKLNKRYVKGFVTENGGQTSHSAIMARTLSIPAVVGTKIPNASLQEGDEIIIDGDDGILIYNPSKEELEYYRIKQAAFLKQQEDMQELRDEPSKTLDGEHIELFCNVGSPEDVTIGKNNGIEGVGLYRTEFIYMEKQTVPTEQEHYEKYKLILEQMDDRPVIIRTMDIGGDKTVPYLNMQHEMNPFLGFRAIRYCLGNESVFRTQLRALLRASVHGHLKIMFPMIATLEELHQAKTILHEECQQLITRGIPFNKHIEIGMMIETPAAAILAKQFAKEVDFFSIGSNDLIQYTMAADRMNEQVGYLYQPYHPAVLQLIANVIESAHSEGKWVGMCGEMAGDPTAIPILLALGLDEFSMNPASILQARACVRSLSKRQLAAHKESILSMATSEDVLSFMKEHFPENKQEIKTEEVYQ